MTSSPDPTTMSSGNSAAEPRGQRVADLTSPDATLAVAQLSRRSRPLAAGLLHAVARRDQEASAASRLLRRLTSDASAALAERHGASLGSRFSLASVRSYRSVLSVASGGSALSVGSLGSLGSAGSILSIGSAGSILSIGSAGSILSIGSSGSILTIGAVGLDDRAEAVEARDAIFGQLPGLIAFAAIAAAAWQALRPTA